MKRHIALLMTLVLCLSLLAACAGESPAPSPSAPAPSQSAAPSAAPSGEPSQEPSEAPAGESSDAPEELPFEEPASTDETVLPPEAEPSESVSPSLTLSMKDAVITYAGYVLTLKPTLTGVPAASSAVLSWSSSDESVATVDQNGNVTSVAPGKTIITAESYGGIQATCIVRCNWKEEDPAPTDSAAPSQPADSGLASFAADIIARYELPSFLQLADAELTEAFYPGLSAADAAQLLVYVNRMSMNMGELVLVEVRDSADVDSVKAILQARIDYMVGDGNGPGGAWYPAPTEEWQNNSRVVSSGNYVMMVVDDDCDAIVDEFNELF